MRFRRRTLPLIQRWIGRLNRSVIFSGRCPPLQAHCFTLHSPLPHCLSSVHSNPTARTRSIERNLSKKENKSKKNIYSIYHPQDNTMVHMNID
jgi:hypothetical protein